VGVKRGCPRCGGPVRPPDLMRSEWRCDIDGPVPPMQVAEHVGVGAVEWATTIPASCDNPVPLWCLWPLPTGWMMTGVGWAGDDRSGPRATAVACSGPAPLGAGAADVVLVAEEPGVGLGARLAGLTGVDPGPLLDEALRATAAHAKVTAAGHPTPLWSVPSPDDRCVYVGEAKGLWLFAVVWPAEAGYVLADHLVLHDLHEWVPATLVFGAPSPYLHDAV
jgi:uncharacterized protein DUF6758